MAQSGAEQCEGIDPSVDLVPKFDVITLLERALDPQHYSGEKVFEGFLGCETNHRREDG